MSESKQAVALVTGSSRGIGRAIAERLAADGYAVLVNYFGNRQAADEVVGSIQDRGGRATAVQADVGQESDRRRLMDSTLDWAGRLDVLVNNAGITSPGRLDVLDATPDNWDRVLATNLKGPFFLCQLAARQMLSQSPRPPLTAAPPPGRDTRPGRDDRQYLVRFLLRRVQ